MKNPYLTRLRRDCLHVVRKIRDPKYRYQCIKCGQLQKILSGVLKEGTI